MPAPLATRQRPRLLPAWRRSPSRRGVMARAEAKANGKIAVRRVESGAQQQLDDFKSMTKSYLEWLGEDLGFQGIERELASLPGSYAEERGGCMLLAYESSGEPGGSEECVGAVALRRLAGHTNTVQAGESVAGVPLERVCEMKRLFVLPGHHGRGVGAALCSELLVQAAALDYQVMVLDTLDRLSGANRLYATLGFQPTERYNDCPLPGVLYFARGLQCGMD